MLLDVLKELEMIKEFTFNTMKNLNNYIVNNSITRSNIVNIQAVYDRGNTDWGIQHWVLFIHEPSILGDSE